VCRIPAYVTPQDFVLTAAETSTDILLASSWLQIRRPGFDSRTTRFSGKKKEKKKENSSGSGTGSTQPREYN
jgi:hypothetical protein